MSYGGSIGGVVAEIIVGDPFFSLSLEDLDAPIPAHLRSPRRRVRPTSPKKGTRTAPHYSLSSPRARTGSGSFSKQQDSTLPAPDSTEAAATSLGGNFVSFLLVIFMYSVHWIYMVSGVFILAAYGWPGTEFLLCVHGLYGISYVLHRTAHRTAARRWSAVRDNESLWDTMAAYFQGRLIPHGELSQDSQYIFGFHPHGIYPGSVLWGLAGSQWRRAYGALAPDVLVANALFRMPILRDISMWFGLKDVSRATLSDCLEGGRSILLVPGGQAEMRVNSSRSEATQNVITYHKGFLRYALKYGVAVVPMYSFGESSVLDDVQLPRLQAWFVKKCGAHFPHLPHGRWGVPFIPRPRRVTLCVGEPLKVECCPDPTPEQVEMLKERYYEALTKLFDERKAEAGYPDWKINLIHSKSC